MKKTLLLISIAFASIVQAQVKPGMDVTTLNGKTQVQLEQMAIAIQKQQQQLAADRKKLQAMIEIKKIEATPTPAPTVAATPTP